VNVGDCIDSFAFKKTVIVLNSEPSPIWVFILNKDEQAFSWTRRAEGSHKLFHTECRRTHAHS